MAVNVRQKLTWKIDDNWNQACQFIRTCPCVSYRPRCCSRCDSATFDSLLDYLTHTCRPAALYQCSRCGHLYYNDDEFQSHKCTCHPLSPQEKVQHAETEHVKNDQLTKGKGGHKGESEQGMVDNSSSDTVKVKVEDCMVCKDVGLERNLGKEIQAPADKEMDSVADNERRLSQTESSVIEMHDSSNDDKNKNIRTIKLKRSRTVSDNDSAPCEESLCSPEKDLRTTSASLAPAKPQNVLLFATRKGMETYATTRCLRIVNLSALPTGSVLQNSLVNSSTCFSPGNSINQNTLVNSSVRSFPGNSIHQNSLVNSSTYFSPSNSMHQNSLVISSTCSSQGNSIHQNSRVNSSVRSFPGNSIHQNSVVNSSVRSSASDSVHQNNLVVPPIRYSPGNSVPVLVDLLTHSSPGDSIHQHTSQPATSINMSILPTNLLPRENLRVRGDGDTVPLSGAEVVSIPVIVRPVMSPTESDVGTMDFHHNQDVCSGDRFVEKTQQCFYVKSEPENSFMNSESEFTVVKSELESTSVKSEPENSTNLLYIDNAEKPGKNVEEMVAPSGVCETPVHADWEICQTGGGACRAVKTESREQAKEPRCVPHSSDVDSSSVSGGTVPESRLTCSSTAQPTSSCSDESVSISSPMAESTTTDVPVSEPACSPHVCSTPPNGLVIKHESTSSPPHGLVTEHESTSSLPHGMVAEHELTSSPPHGMFAPPHGMVAEHELTSSPPHGMVAEHELISSPAHGMVAEHKLTSSPAHGMVAEHELTSSPPHGMFAPPHGMVAEHELTSSPPHGMVAEHELISSPAHGMVAEHELTSSPPHGMVAEHELTSSPPHGMVAEHELTSSPPHGMVAEHESTSSPYLESEHTSSRFVICDEEILRNLEDARQEASTVKQTTWAVKIFKAWLSERKKSSDFEELSAMKLASELRCFYAEVRTKTGNQFSRSALISLRAGINRYLTGPPYSRSINMVKDPEFMAANRVLRGIVKTIRRDGSNTVKHHKPISIFDMRKLYTSGVLSNDNPTSLIRKVWFELALHFSWKGKDGLRQLKVESFDVKTDDVGREYYTLASTECHKPPPDREVRVYDLPHSEHCPVRSLKLYLSKRNPMNNVFFQRPLVNCEKGFDVWYSSIPMGNHTLSSMMSSISKAAKLSVIYTNYCVRTTTANMLAHAGVGALDIMAVTGYRHKQSVRSCVSIPSIS